MSLGPLAAHPYRMYPPCHMHQLQSLVQADGTVTPAERLALVLLHVTEAGCDDACEDDVFHHDVSDDEHDVSDDDGCSCSFRFSPVLPAPVCVCV